jgi:hypothetical protein
MRFVTADKKALQTALEQTKDVYPDAFVRQLHVYRAYHSFKFMCRLQLPQARRAFRLTVLL